MLWTASRIKGYAIAASDGHIGTVSDLLFDDASWQIRWLVVDTGHWLTGRKVLLPTSTLGHANSGRREFSALLTRQQVKDSPDVDTEQPVSRQMETDVYGYYGWSPYWGSGFYTGAYGYGSMMSSPFLGAGLGGTAQRSPGRRDAAQSPRSASAQYCGGRWIPHPRHRRRNRARRGYAG